MREIRFRAWDTRTNDWLPGGKDFNLLGEFTTNGGLNQINWREWDKIVFMQFTGLRDKDGKEIWEGDVVRFKTFGKRQSVTLKVRWDEQTGFFPFTECSYPWLGYVCGANIHKETLEVLGNIYEHPHLLEASHDGE